MLLSSRFLFGSLLPIGCQGGLRHPPHGGRLSAVGPVSVVGGTASQRAHYAAESGTPRPRLMTAAERFTGRTVLAGNRPPIALEPLTLKPESAGPFRKP